MKWGLPYLAVSNSGLVATQCAGHHWMPAFSPLRKNKKKGKSEQPPRNHGDSRRRIPSRRLRTNSRTSQNTATESGEPGTVHKVKLQPLGTPRNPNSCIDATDRNAKAQLGCVSITAPGLGRRKRQAYLNLDATPSTIARQGWPASPAVFDHLDYKLQNRRTISWD